MLLNPILDKLILYYNIRTLIYLYWTLELKILSTILKITKAFLIVVFWIKIMIYSDLDSDEFFLRSEAYSFCCDDKNAKKLKSISESRSKKFKFEKFNNFFLELNIKKDCDNFIFRTINQEMCLRKVCKITLTAFDEKQGYRIEIERTPWIYWCTSKYNVFLQISLEVFENKNHNFWSNKFLPFSSSKNICSR